MARSKKPPRTKAKRKSGSRTKQKQTVAKNMTARQAQEKRSGFALKDDLVEQALISGEHRDLLETYFGEELYEDLRQLTARAHTARTRGGPRVLILPGIMGSKLGRDGFIFDDTIWLDPLDVMRGRLTLLTLRGEAAHLKPLGVLLIVYLKFKLKLQLAGYDAAFHPFDWRRDISEEGAKLANRIRGETASHRQEVYLVAHSLGGLVARAAMKQLDKEKVRRLLMLGTPNYGSFSAVQVLSGYHSLVKKVAALDLKNSHAELVNTVFNTFPSLYQMLPAAQRYSGFDFYNPANWPATGHSPRPDLLSTAPDIQDQLAKGSKRCVLFAGVNQETIVGARKDSDEFLFQLSQGGDGTVPLALAQMDDVTTYFVEESHGSLPNNADVTKAVIDVLESGSTDKLQTSWMPRRERITEVRSSEIAPEPFDGRTGERISSKEIRNLLSEFAEPPEQPRDKAPPALTTPVESISAEPIVIGRRRQQRIDLRLAYGNITQVDARAVVLGLFRGVTPSGAARAIDVQLDGVITEFTERRILSANVGEVFIMPANRYRMGSDFVAFAGLGTYDDFNDEILRLVAENVARTLVRTKVDDFATVLLSSGSGMASGDVLSNLIEGFLRGLRDGDQQGHIRMITICENERARFELMHQELLRLTTTPMFDDVEITVELQELPSVPTPISPRKRAWFPGEDPTYLIVREMTEPWPEETDPSIQTPFTLRASILSAGNKATVVTDTIEVDARKLNLHLERIETDGFHFGEVDDFGTELAEQVLPHLIRKALAGMGDRPIVVIHDVRSSRIPWETVKIDDWFPAAQAGLSRKYEAEDLTVGKWLEERRLADELSVLLIVNPTEDLPGALAEGNRIQEILAQDPAVAVDELRGEDATFSAVRAAFRSGKYDVVHYAGHAFFDPSNRARSGILCHGGHVLTGLHLAQLEMLPALVFFNACEAGRVRSASKRSKGKGTAKRLETNVGLAEAFLRAGVGNYIGTYWPVGDAAAKEFGENFYHSLINGDPVGSAIKMGREKVRVLESVDWADYVHYGSPSFIVKRR